MKQLNEKVEILWKKDQDAMKANIFKQLGKIQKDPTDVKISDVEKGVYDYENHIEVIDNDLTQAYDVLVEFLNA